ncbi:aminotransferase class V [Longispora fulva]|uniref:Isopenicillin-N epimerase n=1 Tax=Longispora fulva TaxID=619741 RepID=A0A8J7H4A4_9ACTN|nr:aminotransferase class V-fold PLP-dependent enzyme [Longispora fulva]MBG6141163.1 isopenicillin-N epimerase [Longispora fulva]GIG62843.1 aminotransferase class V [Longispora fulva]
MANPPTPLPGARDLFTLDQTVLQLNHGSFGAVPLRVQQAQQALRDEIESNPMRFFTRGAIERVEAARRAIAEFLGADPEGTALVANATTAAQIVSDSVALAPGDEVLVTDHGYGAVTMGLRRACDRAGAAVVTVAVEPNATDDEIVAALVAAVGPRTRLAYVDQITSPTALLFPVARIVTALRALGVATLVDAAHVPGALDVDVTAIGADFWLGNMHKWAYAPRGTAVLTVAEEWRPRMEPTIVSWEAHRGFPGAIEWQGTLDYSGWLAAPVGIDVLHDLGWAEVRAHNTALVEYGQRIVAAALDAPAPGSPGLPMRPIPLRPGLVDSQDAAVALRARIVAEIGAEVAISYWGGGGILRLSAQVYNTAAEYERLAEALPVLVKG